MSYTRRQAIYIALGLLLTAACTWWWFANMEQRWTARMHFSEAAAQNPMLGATRLLTRHHHTVNLADTLAQALRSPLPDGTLILLDNSGLITQEQAARLLAWVKRGNTLIVRPKWKGRAGYFACGEQSDSALPNNARNADANNADPIGTAYGMELVERMRRPRATPAKAEDAPPCLTHLTLPNASHALQLEIDSFVLKSSRDKAIPLFGDDTLDAIRVHAHGGGHVAFLAQNYFDNNRLAWYDNAELLLGLAALPRDAKQVLIVQHLDMPSWYQALWWQFKPAIVSAACGLALLFWLAVHRFGPLLPEPERERRSLIEHIDASGRWLWKVPGGRDILLAATRHATEKQLLRRAPELQRLPPAERAARLARGCKLPPEDVARALLEPASKLPIDFTRQIQTLQRLRKHHER